ncbi:hypothetical protein COCNU_02G012870 [Cocos nucifera]|uniref:Uncharacterized protein n=1 Tax=Cocos nucifera TaxID=13894 RepID=A0A8K0I0K5_COCNU|nr:hypothetical protein COCNU_02G012870 [Cocos nucifera]
MPEWMSMPPEQSLTERKEKVPASSTPVGNDASSHRYMDSEHLDIWVLEGGSAFFDPQLARNLVQAILLPTDRELRRHWTLNEMFRSFYLTLIRLFSDLDLSSIVVPDAEKEEEGGGDGSLVDPTNDGAPITILASTELAIPVVPMASVENTSSPSALTGLAF